MCVIFLVKLVHVEQHFPGGTLMEALVFVRDSLTVVVKVMGITL